MTEFKSWRSYWEFAASVHGERRFVHTAKSRAFSKAVRATASRREDKIPGDSYLWRAQRGASTIEVRTGHEDETVLQDYPYPTERMKPLAGRAREGRVNPKGIPYLYLASKRDTAVAEVRPWKLGVVSVGQFRAVRDLRIVNTTLRSKSGLIF